MSYQDSTLLSSVGLSPPPVTHTPDDASQLLFEAVQVLGGRDYVKMKQLLKEGANPNYVDNKTKQSVLLAAIVTGDDRGDEVKILLEAGADPNFEFDGEPLWKCTIRAGRDYVIPWLLHYSSHGVTFTLDDVQKFMLVELKLPPSEYVAIKTQVASQQVERVPQYLQHVVKDVGTFQKS